MKIFWLAVLVFNALLVTGGTLLMRHGGKDMVWSQGVWTILQTGRLWILGMALSWLAGLVFAIVLTRQDLIVTYVFYVSLTYALVVAGGHFLLGEPLSGLKLAGVALSLGGVVCLMCSQS
jgi:multidrug transporter EmrE-like cation transporter